jgi:predicted amidohydrolase YtcJ
VSSFCVDDGKFAAVGSFEDVSAACPFAAAVVDLAGQPVLPGLIDAHAHLMNEGTKQLNADLMGTKTIADVVAKLQEFVAANPIADGEWLEGRGWDQTEFENGGVFPTKADLDAAFPDTPVWLRRVDGHANWANSKLLEVTDDLRGTPISELPDVEGGTIVRDEAGDPTGVFIDTSRDAYFYPFVPETSEEQLERALQLSIASCSSYGITGMHDLGVSTEDIARFEKAIRNDEFNIRNYAMLAGIRYDEDPSLEIPAMDALSAQGVVLDLYEDRLTVKSVKLVQDGALGSYGAGLLAPYTDDPSTCGLLRYEDQDELNEVVRAWALLGYQTNIHAIGDAANQMSLNAFQDLFESTEITSDIRPRIEHSQIVALEDVERFVELGVIASVQPVHGTSDFRFAEDRLGPERILGAYLWRSFLDAGMPALPMGSDFPVEFVDPFYGIHAAVTRQNRNNEPEGGWYPTETLTRFEAIRGHTLDAAYAALQEDVTGSIAPGKFADFIILDKDLLDEEAVADEDLWRVDCLTTYFGGNVIYSTPSTDDRGSGDANVGPAAIVGVAVACVAGIGLGLYAMGGWRQKTTDGDSTSTDPLLP